MLKARRSLLQQTQCQGHGSLCGLALESDGSGLRQIENRFESRIEAGAGLEDTSCLDEGEGVLELQLACDGSAGPGQVLCRLIEQRTGSVITFVSCLFHDTRQIGDPMPGELLVVEPLDQTVRHDQN